ncbi:hypothetical protein AFK68_11730, partial [Hydrocoleum sp. CS-953]|uniref:hypothetical protein n=1 Tax=Hydrocoleum sp. CS-953 TaxID=1671698 RepID=UPI000BDA72D4
LLSSSIIHRKILIVNYLIKIFADDYDYRKKIIFSSRFLKLNRQNLKFQMGKMKQNILGKFRITLNYS